MLWYRQSQQRVWMGIWISVISFFCFCPPEICRSQISAISCKKDQSDSQLTAEPTQLLWGNFRDISEKNHSYLFSRACIFALIFEIWQKLRNLKEKVTPESTFFFVITNKKFILSQVTKVSASKVHSHLVPRVYSTFKMAAEGGEEPGTLLDSPRNTPRILEYFVTWHIRESRLCYTWSAVPGINNFWRCLKS